MPAKTAACWEQLAFQVACGLSVYIAASSESAAFQCGECGKLLQRGMQVLQGFRRTVTGLLKSTFKHFQKCLKAADRKLSLFAADNQFALLSNFPAGKLFRLKSSTRGDNIDRKRKAQKMGKLRKVQLNSKLLHLKAVTLVPFRYPQATSIQLAKVLPFFSGWHAWISDTIVVTQLSLHMVSMTFRMSFTVA